MSPLLVFIASLLGSPHCAGMCGGFVAIASQNTNSKLGQAYYHLGRLITYLVLGIIAGAVGKSLNKLASKAGIDDAALYLTAGILILSGISMLLGTQTKLFKFISLEKIAWIRNKLIPNRSANLRSFGLGLFSTLLPCGWLYTYVLVAGGTGNYIDGLLVMFFFWAGTLPILITIGSLAHLIAKPIKRYVPVLVAIMLIISGFFSIYQHVYLPKSAKGQHHCAKHQSS